MNFRLIAIALISAAFLLTSCEEEMDPGTIRYFTSVNGNLTGSQVRPAPTNSTATGTITGTYDRKTKSYSYTVAWKNLSSTVTAIHIHGIADTGYLALPAPLGPHTNGIAQTAFNFATAINGSYNGNLYVDGLTIKEENLLAGKYYVDIHTTNFPVTSLGEIRGQIQF